MKKLVNNILLFLLQKFAILFDITRLDIAFKQEPREENFKEKQRKVIAGVFERISKAFWGEQEVPQFQPVSEMLEEFDTLLRNADYKSNGSDDLVTRFREWRKNSIQIKDEDLKDFFEKILRELKEISKNENWQKNGIFPEKIDALTIQLIHEPEKPYAGFSSYDKENNTLTISLGKNRYITAAELTLLFAHEGLPGHALDSMIRHESTDKGILQKEENFHSVLGSPYTLTLEGIAHTLGKQLRDEDLERLQVTRQDIELVEHNIALVHRLRYEIMQAFLQGGVDELKKVHELFPGFSQPVIDGFIAGFRQALEKNNLLQLFYHFYYTLGIHKLRESEYNPASVRLNLYQKQPEST